MKAFTLEETEINIPAVYRFSFHNANLYKWEGRCFLGLRDMPDLVEITREEYAKYYRDWSNQKEIL